jgi:segregation and condensation protein B
MREKESGIATSQAPRNDNALDKILEAILFVSGDGLAEDYLAEKLEVTTDEIKAAMEVLRERYSGDAGVHLIKYRKNYQFSSNPAFAGKISEILNPIRERNLTRAALETMAIVAYKQPITRLEIDEIRGVSSDYSVQILVSNNLIEVVGRKDTLGKPLLYGTTDEFLKRFEIEDINHLPSYEELLDKIKVIQTGFDGNLYNSNRGDEQSFEEEASGE